MIGSINLLFRYIPLEKIKKVLLKNNVPAEEVEFLCH